MGSTHIQPKLAKPRLDPGLHNLNWGLVQAHKRVYNGEKPWERILLFLPARQPCPLQVNRRQLVPWNSHAGCTSPPYLPGWPIFSLSSACDPRFSIERRRGGDQILGVIYLRERERERISSLIVEQDSILPPLCLLGCMFGRI